MKIIAELLAEAVEECLTCDGSGWRVPPTPGVEGSWNARHCLDCGGHGKALTTEGYALVEFATLWLAPKFADTDHGHSLH